MSALRVACPTCKAAPGHACTYLGSTPPMPIMSGFHTERIEAGEDIVTKDEARHVLFFSSMPGGEDGGGFVHALLRAIQMADQDNTTKLALVYPGYVAAMKDWAVADLYDLVKEED